MGRHERRRQAKLDRSRSGDPVLAHLLAQDAHARALGHVSAGAMLEALVSAAKEIVGRLPTEPSLSIGDCQVIGRMALATASTQRAALDFAVRLDSAVAPIVKTSMRPTAAEAATILRLVREYLEAVASRGIWSLAGVGALQLAEAPDPFVGHIGPTAVG